MINGKNGILASTYLTSSKKFFQTKFHNHNQSLLGENS